VLEAQSVLGNQVLRQLGRTSGHPAVGPDGDAEEVAEGIVDGVELGFPVHLGQKVVVLVRTTVEVERETSTEVVPEET